MSAAENSRGGVLEPAGIAEIKFRKPELLKAMHRMDKQLQWMSMNEANNVVRPEDIAARETELLPYYQPLGELFSDLHDRPERMLAKGVIKRIVQWPTCREVFYWRLRRRIVEDQKVIKAMEQDPSMSPKDALKRVHTMLGSADLHDDRATLEALERI